MPRHRKNQFKPSRKWTNAVRKVISRQTETKVFHQESEETALTSTTKVAIHTLNNIIIGANNDDRVGNMVKGFGLHLRMALSNVSSPNCWVRVIIIDATANEYDAVSDNYIFKNGASTSLGTNELANIYMGLNKSGFGVLLDRTIKLNGTASVEGGEVKFFKKFLKFNHKVQWDSTATEDAHNHNLRILINPNDALGDTETTIEYSFGTDYYYHDY